MAVEKTAAALGTIGKFVPTEATSWPLYLQCLEFFFQANDIDGNEKKRATLCSVCGPATCAIVRSLCSPDAPSAMAYDEIVRCLSNHFSPRPSVTVKRLKFGTRQQQPGESLTTTSQNCDVSRNIAISVHRLTCCATGWCAGCEATLQRQLLVEPELTPREKAIAMESAQRQPSKFAAVPHRLKFAA